MKLVTPKEKIVMDDSRQFFLDGGSACIACLVKKYWGISLIDQKTGKNKFSNEYIVYKNKQNRIMGRLYNFFRKEKAKRHQLFASKAKENDVLWLLAVNPCPDHASHSQYRLLNSPLDYEIIDNKTRSRIESMAFAKEKRFFQAIRQYPRIFKPRIRTLRIELPYIPGKKKGKKNGSI